MCKAANFQRLAKQFASFGIVGILATLTHATIFHFSYQHFEIPTLSANILGFLVAFSVSYAGQFNYTFRHESSILKRKNVAFLRFTSVALFGFVINVIWAVVIIDTLQLSHYLYLAFLCGVTPAIIFLLTKYWVFVSPDKTAQ